MIMTEEEMDEQLELMRELHKDDFKDQEERTLLQCPFCGGEIELLCLNYETEEPVVWCEDFGNVFTWFRCSGCDTDFYHDEPVHTPEKMIEWWNTRKPMERIVERLEEASYRTDSTFDEDGYSNDDSDEVVLLDKAIEIVKGTLE